MPVNRSEHRQIMGTELEWDVGVRRVGQTEFQSLDSGNPDFWNPAVMTGLHLPEGMQQKNNFMSNGARYYVDINSHPEYATPENTSFKDLLVSERAGERIFANSLHRFLLHYARVDEVAVMKRVLDASGVGVGYHFNISEDRTRIKDIRDIHSVAWHTATSLPMLGGGHIERFQEAGKEYAEGEYDYRYSWAQKVLQIVRDFSDSTTRTRPFINLRDEPHASGSKNWRFHLIGNDPHVLDWPAWMLFGTTSLIVAACRQKRMRSFELADGIGMAKETGLPADSPAAMIGRLATYDLRDDRKYELLVNGTTKRYTANEINKLIMEDAGKVAGMTDEQRAVYEQWEQAADDRDKDVMLLSLRSDGATKLASMRRKHAKSGRDIDSFTERDMAYDQNYSTIFRATSEMAEQKTADEIFDSSPVAVLRSKIRHGTVTIDDAKVKERMLEPPSTTRADLRGFMIKNQVALNLTGVSWNCCKFGNGINENGGMKQRTFFFEPEDGILKS